jgi:hypothetical protein
MNDETSHRPAESSNGGGHCAGSREDGSPFQARAPFLKNWSWKSVVGINQRTCARGQAQHGFNSETGEACAAEWESCRHGELTLAETLDSLRVFHRKAPFLFFNGNTFATIGRELATALFADLPDLRRREVASAVAHYIAGVLDREAMVAIVDSLSCSSDFRPGDRVTTLRGSTHGTVVRLLDDGRISWRPDGVDSELIALPESLLPG